MGHIRLGRLPKTKVWNEVVELLDQEPEDLAGVAAAILGASEQHLNREPALQAAGQAFAVLVHLAEAAQAGRLVDELRNMGVNAENSTPVISVLADVGEQVRRKAATASGHFGDIAGLALRRALVETVGTHTPSLFGSTVEQLQAGFRDVSRGDQFGRLTRLYFGDFLARVMHAAIDRELMNHATVGGSLGDAGASREFSEALDRYARETAGIVQQFGMDWYAKRRFRRDQDVTTRQAVGFTKVALAKLQSDLRFARELV